MLGKYSAGLGAELTRAKIMEMAQKGDASKLTDQQLNMALTAITMMSGKGGTISKEYAEIRDKLMAEKIVRMQRKSVGTMPVQGSFGGAQSPFPIALIIGGVGILAVLAYVVLKKKR